MKEQVDRARAAISASRDNIARSEKRIRESRLRLGGARAPVSFAGIELTDAEMGELLERQHAHAEQREVDREMRRTSNGRDPDGPA